MQAIGYIRWSTLEQGNSDRSSEERQRQAIFALVQANGWTLGEVLVDSGRSAFTGANITKGELGAFTKRVLSGAIDAQHTVLVVEELDRLSRRPPGEMTSWMMPLLTAGLTIAVSNTGQIVTADKVNNDFGSFVSLMSMGFSGYEFSRKQQARGNGAWEKRRRVFIEEGRALSRHRGRKWLDWDAVNCEFVPIPHRVEIVKEMFCLRLEGRGKAAIAKWLNEKGATNDAYAPWKSMSIVPSQWTPSAVSRIVQDPAVTGYIQFYKNPRGSENRIPLGVPVKVYPEVIDEETFARANDERLVHQLRYQGRGRAVSNLIGRLARCKVCGGIMQPLGSSRWKTNKDGSKSQHYPFYCQQAKMSRGQVCTNQTGWAYSKIEAPLISEILPLALDDQYFRGNDEDVVRLEGQAAILRRRIQDQTKQSRNVLALVQDADGADDEIALSAYQAARSRLKLSKAQLEELMKELSQAHGKTTPIGHVVRVAEVRERMEDDDADVRFEARTIAKLALRNLVEAVYFDPSSDGVSVHLRHNLGLMIIRENGKVMFWNLHKPGSTNLDATVAERELVAAYERRTS